LVLRVDLARWGQTPEDLRHLALSAPHARTRERALALFDITQHRCATQVAGRTGRRAHTVMDWVHAYNQGGPDALAFRRTGGRRPFFARTAKPNSAKRSAPPSVRPRRRPESERIQRHAGRCAAWSAGCASASG
jgi:Homeodomain-like domain